MIDPTANVDNITLSFDRFSTEATNDIITVYDGQSNSAPVLGTFSGNALPSSVTSTGDKMFITFSSNASVVSDGFEASFVSKLSKFCDGIISLTNQSDTFSDGSGAFDYNPGTMCRWLIEPPGAATVTITFTSFDTEPFDDFVKIYDPTTTPGTLLAEYSGSNIPPPITSPSGKMYLMFFSDNSHNADGWEAIYTTATAINENHSIHDLSLFPNPAKDYFSVTYTSNNEQKLSINVFDVTGKTCYTKEVISSVGINKYRLNVSSLRQGIYMVRVYGSDFVLNRKIVIQ